MAEIVQPDSVNAVKLRDSSTGAPMAQDGTDGAAHVEISSVAAGVSIGSGLPNGAFIAQPDLAATATITSKQIFSAPAKGVRLLLVDASSADPDLYALVCFDPPNDAVQTDWLTTTLAGPRHKLVPGKALEISFKTLDGTPTVANSMGYVFSATANAPVLSVEVVS